MKYDEFCDAVVANAMKDGHLSAVLICNMSKDTDVVFSLHVDEERVRLKVELAAFAWYLASEQERYGDMQHVFMGTETWFVTATPEEAEKVYAGPRVSERPDRDEMILAVWIDMVDKQITVRSYAMVRDDDGELLDVYLQDEDSSIPGDAHDAADLTPSILLPFLNGYADAIMGDTENPFKRALGNSPFRRRGNNPDGQLN